ECSHNCFWEKQSDSAGSAESLFYIIRTASSAARPDPSKAETKPSKQFFKEKQDEKEVFCTHDGLRYGLHHDRLRRR
ncbi:MAG: hypothetical protein IJA73_00525, partial [Oscillospiraceae bacterium]|nr:hypothetical protein [Oscillospiraceae bacterium]